MLSLPILLMAVTQILKRAVSSNQGEARIVSSNALFLFPPSYIHLPWTAILLLAKLQQSLSKRRLVTLSQGWKDILWLLWTSSFMYAIASVAEKHLQYWSTSFVVLCSSLTESVPSKYFNLSRCHESCADFFFKSPVSLFLQNSSMYNIYYMHIELAIVESSWSPTQLSSSWKL